MKKAFHVKVVALLVTLAALASVMVTPAFSFIVAKADEQTADSINCGDPVVLPAEKKRIATVNSKAAGGDSELPFIPNETEHDWDDGKVTKAPTCTQPGVKTYTCRINSKHTYTEEIPATGHTPDEAETENENAATCTEDGSYEEVVYCSVCGYEISRETKVIPAFGHDWDDGTVTKEATCEESGIRTFTCDHDPSHTYSEIIPKAEHTPGEAVTENEVPSTCCASGSYDEAVYCSVCGAEIGREQKTIPIDADAHAFGEWVQTKAPTETNPGEETRTCTHDPSHKETREIAPLGPLQVEFSFLDCEVIIVVPDGAIPEGSGFDVRKIVPPPAEIVEKVKNQTEAFSEVLSYYEIRLFDTHETPVVHLDGEITVKTKLPERYAKNNSIRIIQEDDTGKLITMTSWLENGYLCYKTDWLETYN